VPSSPLPFGLPPESGPTESGMVTFINSFTLRTSPEEFEQAFAQISEFMVRQPGFLRYMLLRQVGECNSYVNIAHWQDAESFRSAVTRPGFRSHAAALRAVSTSESDLYISRQTFSAEGARGYPSLGVGDSNRAC
jgi:quinol monooxygenase YgiN